MTQNNYFNGHNLIETKVACIVFDKSEQTIELAYKMAERGTHLALLCENEDSPTVKALCNFAVAQNVKCLPIAGNPRDPIFAQYALQKIEDYFHRLDYYFDLTTPTPEFPLPNYQMMGKAFQQISHS